MANQTPRWASLVHPTQCNLPQPQICVYMVYMTTSVKGMALKVRFHCYSAEGHGNSNPRPIFDFNNCCVVGLGLFNLNWPSSIILYNLRYYTAPLSPFHTPHDYLGLLGCRSCFVQVPSLARLKTGCLVSASIPKEQFRDSAKVALRQPYSLKQALHRNPNHYTFLNHWSCWLEYTLL